MMQMIHNNCDHPGQASVVFLPMIDMDPNDINCINSTLYFISDHASRYNVTPVLTFDQPLWLKATMIIDSGPVNSHLRRIVLRLGGFHTIMSFLGLIGHLMSGTGLKELLELIFAENAVTHMLSGKAVARAIRGHLLVISALYVLIVVQVFNIDLQQGEHFSLNDMDTGDLPGELQALGQLYDEMKKQSNLDTINSSEVLPCIYEKIEAGNSELMQSRTAKLWFQYMDIVYILQQFIRSERTGD